MAPLPKPFVHTCGVCPWLLCPTPWLCVCALMPVLHSFDDCRFVVSFEIRKCEPPQPLSPFPCVICVSRLFLEVSLSHSPVPTCSYAPCRACLQRGMLSHSTQLCLLGSCPQVLQGAVGPQREETASCHPWSRGGHTSEEQGDWSKACTCARLSEPLNGMY